jgi:hypothetical protein
MVMTSEWDLFTLILSTSILSTCQADSSLLDFSTLTTAGDLHNNEVLC